MPLVFATICHAAGFEADDPPLAIAPVVDAGIAVVAADIGSAVGAGEFGTAGHNGSVAVDPHFQIAEVQARNMDGAGSAHREEIGLGFEGAISSDAEVVVGQQVLHHRHVGVEQGAAPVLLKVLNLLVLPCVIAMRKRDGDRQSIGVGSAEQNTTDEHGFADF